MVKPGVRHPNDLFVRSGRLPSEWCPGCGIGIAVNTFLQTVQKLGFGPERITLVSSGIGCTGKVASYLKFKTVDAPVGQAIEAAVRQRREDPGAKIVLFLNDK